MRLQVGIVMIQRLLSSRQHIGIERGDAFHINSRTQRLGATGFRTRVPKFASEIGEHSYARRLRFPFTNCALDYFRMGEMDKNRHQIGETFMKRGNIDICWIQEKGPQAIKESMGGFVRNDVMAQRGANDAVAQSETSAFFSGIKKAEGKISRFSAVTSVCDPRAEWPHDQAKWFIGGIVIGRPRDVATQCPPERRIG